jgi:hypothetical protein
MPVPPYLHLLNACPAVPTSTQCLSCHTYIYSTPVPLYSKKRRECFLIHEIGRINGGRGFRSGRNMFRIGRNIFYDWKNKIPMKIPEFKRSEIGVISEFRRTPSGFPNQTYLLKYNNYINLSAILMSAGKKMGDLSSLPQYCTPTGTPLLCWNNVLGRYFRGKKCKFFKGHVSKGNATDKFADNVVNCISKGVVYYTKLPQRRYLHRGEEDVS